MITKIVGSIVISSTLTWLLFVFLYRPSDHDYLVTTTAYYFKKMSETGYAKYALFDDCYLQVSDAAQGVSKFGICKTQTELKTLHFSIAISSTGRYLYSDFEEIDSDG